MTWLLYLCRGTVLRGWGGAPRTISVSFRTDIKKEVGRSGLEPDTAEDFTSRLTSWAAISGSLMIGPRPEFGVLKMKTLSKHQMNMCGENKKIKITVLKAPLIDSKTLS